jgi:hypothetical protein
MKNKPSSMRYLVVSGKAANTFFDEQSPCTRATELDNYSHIVYIRHVDALALNVILRRLYAHLPAVYRCLCPREARF